MKPPSPPPPPSSPFNSQKLKPSEATCSDHTDSPKQATPWFEQAVVPKTNVPWYKPDIGPRLKPETRELYRTYSGLADEEITDHLRSIRDQAWSFGEYPCVGEWLFLLPSICAFPNYQDLLRRVKAGAAVLDLGCCFGQDLRRLAADGTSTENMYASDLHPELWQLGYDLFRDRGWMRARFLQADIFDPGLRLSELQGKVDVVMMCQFLHLFSWEQQVEALKRVVEMSRPGTVVLGYQIGRTRPEEVERPWGRMFYHNKETFVELWRRVEKETGIRWMMNVALVSLEEWGMEREDYEWMAPTSRGVNFIVQRQDMPEGRSGSLSL